jgi:hypothetical protein
MALRSRSSISRHLTVGSSRRALGRSSFSVMPVAALLAKAPLQPHQFALVSALRVEC